MAREVSESERASELLERLPAATVRRIDEAREVARRLGLAVWWAGGGVRDLLLRREVLDLDLVVEREAGAFAAALAARWGGRCVEYPRFLTATVELPGGAAVDLATARREIYESPATLPRVEVASIEDDLARRDFTINALALCLEPAADNLLDPFGGRADLAAGRLRVLHPASFRDDPTRVLRGLRFALRFGMGFTDETARLARQAVAAGHFARLSAERVRRESERLCAEAPGLARVVEALAAHGLLDGLDLPAAQVTVAAERLEAAAQRGRELDFVGGGLARPRRLRLALLALASSLARPQRAQLAERFGVVAEDAALVLEGPERAARAAHGVGTGAPGREVPAHVAARLLAPLATEELLLVAASSPAAAAWVERDLHSLRRFALGITGGDLSRAGVPPGRALGAALRETRDARLDGEIDADEELAFALRAARRMADSG